MPLVAHCNLTWSRYVEPYHALPPTQLSWIASWFAKCPSFEGLDFYLNILFYIVDLVGLVSASPTQEAWIAFNVWSLIRVSISGVNMVRGFGDETKCNFRGTFSCVWMSSGRVGLEGKSFKKVKEEGIKSCFHTCIVSNRYWVDSYCIIWKHF